MPAHPAIKLIHTGADPELKLEYNVLRKTILVLRSLNHKFRQQIIRHLLENDQLTVTELFNKLKVEQSVASQHLAILRRSGVVVTKREGKFIYYSLNKDRLREITEMVTELLQ